jgi:hypothetical protein
LAAINAGALLTAFVYGLAELLVPRPQHDADGNRESHDLGARRGRDTDVDSSPLRIGSDDMTVARKALDYRSDDHG